MVISLDPLAAGKVSKDFFSIQGCFLFEKDVSECAYYFFDINRVTSSRPEVFGKKSCSRKFCKIQRKTPESHFKACSFIKKKTLTQVFSCEFCKISKSTFFHRTPLVARSLFSTQSSIYGGVFFAK